MLIIEGRYDSFFCFGGGNNTPTFSISQFPVKVSQ